MYYEINVAKNGKHVFATSERSIRNLNELKKIYSLFLEKFPAFEGYELRVTKYEEVGHEVDPKEIF